MFSFSRRMLFLPLLLAAIGVPYALSTEGRSQLNEAVSSWFSSGEKDQAETLLAELPAEGEQAEAPFRPATHVPGLGDEPPPLTGPPVRDLAEVFNFGVTPEWVTSRWGRVSTVLSELEFEGMRVALVTGPNADDLAGSLTYYFDKQHRVRRLTFDGTTGDPRRLVALVQSRFGLTHAPSLDAGLYVTKWNGVPRSALLISHPAVVEADRPMTRYNVKLEINLPEPPYNLSDEFSRLLERETHNARW